MWNPSEHPYLSHATSTFGTSNSSFGEAPSSIRAYQKYGVKPSIIRHISRLSPTISHFKECFSKYYLLYWEGSYILREIATGNSILKHQGINYIPCYSTALGTTPRNTILKAKEEQYSLSFRLPMEEFEIPGYVFISPIKK